MDLAAWFTGLRNLMFAIALVYFVANPAIAAGLPTLTLKMNGHKVTAEVASTPQERATGLMHRFSLAPDTGMLFVFEHPETLGFWMKNTYIPLSIAFIDGDGRILNIEDMAPQTENSHFSQGPALYALEMRKGWFDTHGVKAGDKVEGVRASLSRK